MTTPAPMKTWVIYKYLLQDTMELPMGARPLSIQDQKGSLVMWCQIPVETMTQKVTRYFTVMATGRHFQTTHNNSWAHLATIQQDDGGTVWHIFERT